MDGGRDSPHALQRSVVALCTRARIYRPYRHMRPIDRPW